MPSILAIRDARYHKINNEISAWNLIYNENLFQDSWHSLNLVLIVRRKLNLNDTFDSTLRFYTELGYKEFCFTLRLISY